MRELGVLLLCCSLFLHTSCDSKQGSQSKEVPSSSAKEVKSVSVRGLSNSEKTVRLAVFSITDVAKKSKAGRSIDEQIEEINNKSKEDLLELENSIKKMDSDAKTSSDERKVDDLQVILYDMTKEKRYQIEAAFKSALGVLNEEIRKVVEEIASEKGYSLIVVSEAVFFSSSECPDITEEAIRRLDSRIPKIKVDITKKDPAER